VDNRIDRHHDSWEKTATRQGSKAPRFEPVSADAI
jgi:hypothetical protein